MIRLILDGLTTTVSQRGDNSSSAAATSLMLAKRSSGDLAISFRQIRSRTIFGKLLVGA